MVRRRASGIVARALLSLGYLPLPCRRRTRRPPARERVIISVRDPPGANDSISCTARDLTWSRFVLRT